MKVIQGLYEVLLELILFVFLVCFLLDEDSFKCSNLALTTIGPIFSFRHSIYSLMDGIWQQPPC